MESLLKSTIIVFLLVVVVFVILAHPEYLNAVYSVK